MTPFSRGGRWPPVAIATFVIGILITGISSKAVYELEHDTWREQFDLETRRYTHAIDTALREQMMVLNATRNLLLTTVGTDRESFGRFVTPLLENNDSLLSVAWVPTVLAGERNGYELVAQSYEGLEEFRFTALDDAGEIVLADSRPSYFPLYFAEPDGRSAGVLGLDLTSNPRVHAAMINAIHSERTTTTSPVSLPPAPPGDPSVLVLLPVPWGDSAWDRSRDDGSNIRGFVLGVLSLAKLIELSGIADSADDIELRILDVTGPGDARLVSPSPDRTRETAVAAEDVPGVHTAREIAVGDRNWRIEVSPRAKPGDPYYLLRSAHLATVASAALGTLLTFMGFAYVTLLTRRTRLAADAASAAREKSRRSDAHFQHLVEGSIQGILVHRDWKLLFVNQSLAGMLGYADPRSMLDGCDLRSHVAAHDREKFGEMAEPGAQTAAPVQHFELDWSRADGTPIRVLSSVRRVAWNGTRAIQITCIDITESRLAQLRQRQLADIIEMSPDLVCTFDLEGRAQFMNQAGRRLLGFDENEDLRERSISGLFPREQVDQLRESAGSSSRTARMWEGETALQTAAGEVLTVSQQILLHDSSEMIPDRYYSMVMHDITERKNSETALRNAKEAAETAARAKSNFLATMSHEIRTPMNGVLGMAQLLGDSELDAEQVGFVEVIQRSGTALLSLIDDILDLSKVEAGRLEFEEMPFDLRTVAEDIVRLLDSKASNQGNHLMLDYAESCPRHLVGDGRRIGQVITNLAGNAVKFTSNGEIRVSIDGASRDDGTASVRVLVADTGIGISEDARARIFDSFTQADSSTTRQFGGTGLGLAISGRIIEAMGGSIEVDSTPGEGARFRFEVTLPMASTDDVMGDAGADAGPEAAASSDAPIVGRVLLAEDNPVNQKVATAMLSRFGVTWDVAENGLEALRRLEGAEYDLVLMDCQMPEMDGFAATREIRAREHEDRRIPIIAVTANAMLDDEARCLEAGMDDYIPKPLSQASLQATLQRWLPQRPGVAAEMSVSGKAEPGPARTGPILDPAQLQTMRETMGDDFPVLVATFVESATELTRALRESLAQADLDAARRHMHSLKSAAGHLGAVALADVAKSLEDAAAAGTLGAGDEDVVQMVEQEIDRALRALSESEREVA